MLRRKKIIISLIVISLLIIAGGVFWWWQETGDAYRYNKPENFVIRDAPEGKIVENKKAGLIVETDNNWQADIWSLAGDGTANFFSADAEFYQNGAFKKGSWIFIEILNCDRKNPLLGAKIECEETKKIISEFQKNPSGPEEIDSYKIRRFGQFMAIKKTESREIDDGRILEHISIKVPVSDKLYNINGVLIPPDEKKYSQFEEFLGGVMIQ